MMSDNLVSMTFEIELDVYDQASEVCKQLGTTIEIMAESFIKFCVVPENLPLLEAFLVKEKAPAEAGAKEEVNRRVFEKVFAIASEETIRRGISDIPQHSDSGYPPTR